MQKSALIAKMSKKSRKGAAFNVHPILITDCSNILELAGSCMSNCLQIDRYVCHCRDRNDGRDGGGLLVYVKMMYSVLDWSRMRVVI